MYAENYNGLTYKDDLAKHVEGLLLQIELMIAVGDNFSFYMQTPALFAIIKMCLIAAAMFLGDWANGIMHHELFQKSPVGPHLFDHAVLRKERVFLLTRILI